MNKQIYLNIPIQDLTKTMDYFKELGFEFNMDFTDDKSAAMVVSEDITIMMLNHESFKRFTKKEIINNQTHIGSIIALNCESKEQVSEMTKKAIELGGTAANDPYDYGWMYGESFYDINGHMWELIYFSGEKPADAST